MCKRVHLMALAVGLTIMGLGCADGSFSFNYVEEEPPVRVVHVEPAHVCTHACAHYYHDGHYVVVKRGHHHGPGCGHVFVDGRWMVAVAAPAHVHVCSHDCHHHYWSGSKLVALKGHRHGPGCGHVYDGSHWIVAVSKGHSGGVVEVQKVPATHAHSAPARGIQVGPPPGPVNLYALDRRGSKWVKVSKGHAHGPGCGHVHVEGHWCLP